MSINDSSWLLERDRWWLVIDGEMLCILLWLKRTNKFAAKGTRRGHIGHLYDSTNNMEDVKLNFACELEAYVVLEC